LPAAGIRGVGGERCSQAGRGAGFDARSLVVRGQVYQQGRSLADTCDADWAGAFARRLKWVGSNQRPERAVPGVVVPPAFAGRSRQLG
jgi:hypothetical protein